MARDRSSSPEPLDEVLGDLPSDFVVRSLGPVWLVAGPTGIFVVAGGPGAMDGSERSAGVLGLGRLAAEVRSVLADQLTLVPMVQPLIVTSRPGGSPDSGATVVPPDLLLDVLVSGSTVLGPQALARVAAVVDAGNLQALGGPLVPPMPGWLGAGSVE